jgi:hypothetical protein
MDITIDKEDYKVVTTSYGFVTDDDGNIYPFEVEVTEVEGEDQWIEISWDDDQPENVEDVESEITDLF